MASAVFAIEYAEYINRALISSGFIDIPLGLLLLEIVGRL